MRNDPPLVYPDSPVHHPVHASFVINCHLIDSTIFSAPQLRHLLQKVVSSNVPMYPHPIPASESLIILVDEVLVILKRKMHEVSDPSSVPILHLVMLACNVSHLLMHVSFSSGNSLVLCPVCV